MFLGCLRGWRKGRRRRGLLAPGRPRRVGGLAPFLVSTIHGCAARPSPQGRLWCLYEYSAGTVLLPLAAVSLTIPAVPLPIAAAPLPVSSVLLPISSVPRPVADPQSAFAPRQVHQLRLPFRVEGSVPQEVGLGGVGDGGEREPQSGGVEQSFHL